MRTLMLVIAILLNSQAFAENTVDPSTLPPLKAELVDEADVAGDIIDVEIFDESYAGELDDMSDAQFAFIFGDDGLVAGKSSKACGKGRGCTARNGVASWYGPGFHGRKTANGETFDQNALTAASRTICFHALVRVTYKGKSVVVRINDAGPYAHGRVIDLSKAAANKLGLQLGSVTLQIVKCG